MSLIVDLRTQVLYTDVFVQPVPPPPGPTAEGAYGGSLWPQFRGPANSMAAQSAVVGPTLGAGLVLATGAPIDFNPRSAIFDEAGNVFNVTINGAVVKYDAAGQLLYISNNTSLGVTFTQLVYAGNGTLFYTVSADLATSAPATFKVVDTGSALITNKISDKGTNGQMLLTAGGNLIFSQGSGVVVCMTPDGTTVWENTALLPTEQSFSDSGWNLSLDITTNVLYVFTEVYLNALSGVTGATLHATYLGFVDPILNVAFSTPTVGSDNVYFGTVIGLVACKKDTTLAWINREVGSCFDSAPAYNAKLNTVYVGTANYMLVGVNGTTGATLFSVGILISPGPVDFFKSNSPVIDAAGSVYIFSYADTDLGGLGVYKFSATGVYDSHDLITTGFLVISIGPNGKLYLPTTEGLKFTP